MNFNKGDEPIGIPSEASCVDQTSHKPKAAQQRRGILLPLMTRIAATPPGPIPT